MSRSTSPNFNLEKANECLLAMSRSIIKLKQASCSPEKLDDIGSRLVSVSPVKSDISEAGSFISTAPLTQNEVSPPREHPAQLTADTASPPIRAEERTHSAVVVETEEEDSFSLFMDDHREDMFVLHPGAKQSEIDDLLGVVWNTLSSEDKAGYKERAAEETGKGSQSLQLTQESFSPSTSLAKRSTDSAAAGEIEAETSRPSSDSKKQEAVAEDENAVKEFEFAAMLSQEPPSSPTNGDTKRSKDSAAAGGIEAATSESKPSRDSKKRKQEAVTEDSENSEKEPESVTVIMPSMASDCTVDSDTERSLSSATVSECDSVVTVVRPNTVKTAGMEVLKFQRFINTDRKVPRKCYRVLSPESCAGRQFDRKEKLKKFFKDRGIRIDSDADVKKFEIFYFAGSKSGTLQLTQQPLSQPTSANGEPEAMDCDDEDSNKLDAEHQQQRCSRKTSIENAAQERKDKVKTPVWVKTRHFPPWPSIQVELFEVPAKYYAGVAKAKKKGCKLVFFLGQHAFGWVKSDQISSEETLPTRPSKSFLLAMEELAEETKEPGSQFRRFTDSAPDTDSGGQVVSEELCVEAEASKPTSDFQSKKESQSRAPEKKSPASASGSGMTAASGLNGPDGGGKGRKPGAVETLSSKTSAAPQKTMTELEKQIQQVNSALAQQETKLAAMKAAKRKLEQELAKGGGEGDGVCVKKARVEGGTAATAHEEIFAFLTRELKFSSKHWSAVQKEIAGDEPQDVNKAKKWIKKIELNLPFKAVRPEFATERPGFLQSLDDSSSHLDLIALLELLRSNIKPEFLRSQH